ncbi:MAG: DUF1385 domain-containing protein [Christensenellales bacterium]
MSKKNKDEKVKRTLIGGQALMEGVMMQGATSMALSVRTEEGDILTETKRLRKRGVISRIPIVRGCVAFVKSLITGTGTMLRSAEVVYPEGETPSKGAYAVATVLGILLAVGLFILLPSFLVSMLGKLVTLGILLSSLIEGLIRIALFVLYLFIVSRMKEIKRTFMYHGAEHRTINCFEKGMELTPENVQNARPAITVAERRFCFRYGRVYSRVLARNVAAVTARVDGHRHLRAYGNKTVVASARCGTELRTSTFSRAFAR